MKKVLRNNLSNRIFEYISQKAARVFTNFAAIQKKIAIKSLAES